MGEVEWTQSGLDTLDVLNPDVQERILDKLEAVEDWPEHFLDSLSGYPYYKLRVGDYRVLIDWDRETDTLYVGAVGHRRNVYDRHLPP